MSITKKDLQEVISGELKDFREVINAELKDFREATNAGLKDFRDGINIELQDFREDINEELKDFKEGINVELKDFKEGINVELKDFKESIDVELKSALKKSETSLLKTMGKMIKVSIEESEKRMTRNFDLKLLNLRLKVEGLELEFSSQQSIILEIKDRLATVQDIVVKLDNRWNTDHVLLKQKVAAHSKAIEQNSLMLKDHDERIESLESD